jgi:autotransporter-associated beta strand protein
MQRTVCRRRRTKLVLLAAATAGSAALLGGTGAAHAQLRSFGAAEGFGAMATGGRTGTVVHVTNLNDSGTGSFRDAVSGSNRIIVFDVGGVINLTTAVSCSSNLTILGQTAPGAGIAFDGGEIGFSSHSNIICQYVRFRPGDSTQSSTDDCVGMYNTQNAILDHCSLEFAPYDNIDAVTDNGNDSELTFQHNIIADPIGQQFGAHLEAVNGHITLASNIFANSHNRNPLAKCNEQFINNVDYNNEASYTTHTSTPFKHDLVNNDFIFGPATSGNTYYQLSSGDTFYATGNIQDSDKDGNLDTGSITNPTTGTIVSSPNFSSTQSLPTLNVTDAYNYAIAHAGASLTRDDLDNLVISQVQTLGSGTPGKGVGTSGPSGGLYGSAASTGLANGGLGNTAAGTRPAGFDTDNDGVPNAWEITHGMNPNVADSTLKNPLGYTMIEQYAQELGDENATIAWTASSTPGVFDHATIRGTGAANGSMTVTTAPTPATAPQMLSLSIGGNGPAAGETLTVSGSGRLNVYDTIAVGDFNNATVNITGGTLSAYNFQLGHTDFSGASPVSYTGTFNVSGGTVLFNSIVLGAGTPGSWTSGGQINFSGGTLKAQNSLGSQQAVSSFLVNVPIAVTGTTATFNTNGYDGTISGNLSGAGTLTKSGAGTLTLSGANSGFSGPIKLTTGAITLATNSTNSSTGTITMSNGTQLNVTTSGASTPLALASGATATISAGGLTYNGAISGPAGTTLTVSTTSTGNFSLGGSMTGFSGTLDLAASTGNVRIGGTGSSTANFSLGTSTGAIRNTNDGTVNLGSLSGGASTKLQGSTNGTVATTYVIGGNGTSTTFNGIITNGVNTPTAGVTNITKTGAGTLTLSNAASTYTGATTISGGTLSVATLANGGAASSIGQSTNAAANLVLDGGTLKYTGAAVTTDRDLTLTQNGGALDSSGSAANTFGGGQTVALAGSGARTLTFTGSDASRNIFHLVLGDGAGGSTSVLKTGAGKWTYDLPQTYSGDTTVTGGTLEVIANGVMPHGAGKGNLIVPSGGTFDMHNNPQTINALSDGGGAGGSIISSFSDANHGLTIGDGDASGTFSGSIATGLNSLTKIGNGTQTLVGTSSYTGATNVNGGTLTLSNAGSLASTSLTAAMGATLNINGAIPTTAAVTANGTVNFAGNGGSTPLALSIGPLTIGASGDAVVLGSHLNTAPMILTPASLTITPGGQLDLTNNELITNEPIGMVQSQLSTGAITSSLAGSNGAALGYLDLANGTTEVRYTLLGDSDLDGQVNVADLANLAGNFGVTTGATWIQGDFDYNGSVNVADLADLAGNFGQTLPAGGTAASAALSAGSSAATSVPEPAAAAIVAVVALAATSLSRRQRRDPRCTLE